MWTADGVDYDYRGGQGRVVQGPGALGSLREPQRGVKLGYAMTKGAFPALGQAAP